MSKENKRKILLKSKLWILCEGKTEKCYFNVANNLGKLGNITTEIKIIGQISGSNKNKIKSIRKKVDYSDNDLRITNSKVFILLDIDGVKKESYSQKEIDFIKNNLENENIKVLFSNKDFELWILLHLQDCIKENVDYVDLIKKHKNGDKNYKKGDNNCNIKFFSQIINKYLENAINRAKKLEKIHKNKVLKEKIPYTEVYKVFDYLKI